MDLASRAGWVVTYALNFCNAQQPYRRSISYYKKARFPTERSKFSPANLSKSGRMMNMMRIHWQIAWLCVLTLGEILSPIGLQAPCAIAQESLVAPEKNPPGDIPDDQVFIRYDSPEGFSLKVPEGWSRKDIDHGVRFFDKYGIIEVSVADATELPKARSISQHAATDLAKDGRPVEVTSVKDVKLKAGPVVRISYKSNSEPNPVTNKRLLLEHERYLFFRDGKLVTLDLAAPAGADNVDQWRMMSNSFHWES